MRRSWWPRVARLALRRWPQLGAAVALMVAGVALEVLKPWPLKMVVDHLLEGRPLPEGAAWLAALPGARSPTVLLAWLAGGTVIVAVAAGLTQIARNLIQARAGSRMTYDLGGAMFEHLQRLSATFHRRHATGDLVRRVTTDAACARELVMGAAMPALTAVASLAAMFVVMWQLDATLTVLALGVVLPLAVVIRLFAEPMTRRSYEHQQLEGEVMALAESTLGAIPLVQAFAQEAHEEARFRDLSGHRVVAYLRSLGFQVVFKLSTGSITALGTATMIAVGGFRALQGELTLGGLLVFLSYLASLYSPLETMAYLTSSLADTAAKGRRVAELLECREWVAEEPAARPLPNVRDRPPGEVRLESVTVGYEPGRPVLHGISLEVPAGQVAALVGRTGAGKSTLVGLIPRLLDPWQGRVLVDGCNVRSVRLSSLRARVAMLLQEPFLLPITVAENIAYGCPDAGRERVIAAAEAAHADRFIRRLPLGYDTVLGERGLSLSGGERQRIAIARALLKDAPILILDEPTSALDGAHEALVMEAIERLMRGRTVLVIAHRLSTVRRADRIIVLDEGRIVETGTHDQLLAMNGRYLQLHRAWDRAPEISTA